MGMGFDVKVRQTVAILLKVCSLIKNYMVHEYKLDKTDVNYTLKCIDLHQ